MRVAASYDALEFHSHKSNLQLACMTSDFDELMHLLNLDVKNDIRSLMSEIIFSSHLLCIFDLNEIVIIVERLYSLLKKNFKSIKELCDQVLSKSIMLNSQLSLQLIDSTLAIVIATTSLSVVKALLALNVNSLKKYIVRIFSQIFNFLWLTINLHLHHIFKRFVQECVTSKTLKIHLDFMIVLYHLILSDSFFIHKFIIHKNQISIFREAMMKYFLREQESLQITFRAFNSSSQEMLKHAMIVSDVELVRTWVKMRNKFVFYLKNYVLWKILDRVALMLAAIETTTKSVFPWKIDLIVERNNWE